MAERIFAWAQFWSDGQFLHKYFYVVQLCVKCLCLRLWAMMWNVTTVFSCLWLEENWWFWSFPNVSRAAHQVVQIIVHAFSSLVIQLHQTKSFVNWHFGRMTVRKFYVALTMVGDHRKIRRLLLLQAQITKFNRRQIMFLYFRNFSRKDLLNYLIFELTFEASILPLSIFT